MTKLTRGHIHSRLFSNTKKYCVRHDGRAEEGEWITSKDGLRRQFVCVNCLKNEKNRMILHAAKHESFMDRREPEPCFGNTASG